MYNLSKKYDPFDLVDPFFDDLFDVSNKNEVMKTDIKDNGGHYEMKVELPEVKRENLHLELDNGYLVITASLNKEDDEKKHGHYIRRERYYGSYKRSFYVGDNLKEEDIKAKLENGVLTLLIPKAVEAKQEKKYIAIE